MGMISSLFATQRLDLRATPHCRVTVDARITKSESTASVLKPVSSYQMVAYLTDFACYCEGFATK